MTKYEVRMTKYEVRMTKYEVRSTNDEWRMTNDEWRMTDYSLRMTIILFIVSNRPLGLRSGQAFSRDYIELVKRV